MYNKLYLCVFYTILTYEYGNINILMKCFELILIMDVVIYIVLGIYI